MMEYINLDENGVWQLDSYFEYLKEIEDKIPKEIFDFVIDIDRYQISGPQTLHDSQFCKLIIDALSFNTKLELELVGPYHDRGFMITYKGVTYYKCEQNNISLGDLLIHEMTFNNCGIRHEIIFDNGSILVESDIANFKENIKST